LRIAPQVQFEGSFSMKLHHVPGARSCRVRWLLEELGIEYELDQKALADGSLRTPEYLALNPLGRVPTFEDAGVVFYESGAIVQYLLERYGAGRLAPSIESPSRPIFLQWFHWAEATLMPPIAAINSNRFVLKEKDRSETALSVGRRQLARALRVLGTAVEGRAFLVDDAFSAADIMTAYSVTLAQLVGELPDEPESVHVWLAGLAARPAYQRSFTGGFG
jgi:glutathione S-transferase